MKKLEKLVLQDVAKIPKADQKSLYGGGSWVTGADGITYYLPGEVTVMGLQEPEGGWESICPACQRFHNYNENHPMSHGEPVTTPLGEYLFNTLPHDLSLGQHINGSETYYTVTLTDGTVIKGSGD
jgi:hypothetical protein